MKIRFKFNAKSLSNALDVVSVASPPDLTAEKKTSCYLFLVRGQTCSIYMRSAVQVARADFPIESIEGEGAFLYKSGLLDAFKVLEDDEIELEADNEGEYPVKWVGKSGAESEHNSFDPALISTFDKDINGAPEGQTISSELLYNALTLSKPFLAAVNSNHVKEQWKIAQLFDGSQPETAKGNAHLYAADNVQAFYFFCEAFRDRSIAVHGSKLSTLLSFLSKCSGNVTIRRGANMTYVVSKEQDKFIGWSHQNEVHTNFSFYSPKQDDIVFSVPIKQVLRSLMLIRTQMPPDEKRIQVEYCPNDDGKGVLKFKVKGGSNKAASFPVPISIDKGADVKVKPLSVVLDYFCNLFEGTSGGNVDLRIKVVEAVPGRNKESAMLRTMDNYWVDSTGKILGGSKGLDTTKLPEGAVQCLVTRYISSVS